MMESNIVLDMDSQEKKRANTAKHISPARPSGNMKRTKLQYNHRDFANLDDEPRS